MKTFEGQMDGQGKRFALVVSRFNELVSSKLLGGAIDALKRHGAKEKDLAVAWVPGSFELPLVARRLAEKGDYDAVICLGALIRGATPHFEYISAQVARGIAKIAEDSGIPVGFGVLTCDTLDQALERSGSKAGNKGADAALACLETVTVLDAIAKG